MIAGMGEPRNEDDAIAIVFKLPQGVAIWEDQDTLSAGCIKLSEGNKHTKILQIENSSFPTVRIPLHCIVMLELAQANLTPAASEPSSSHRHRPPGSLVQAEIDSHNVCCLFCLQARRVNSASELLLHCN